MDNTDRQFLDAIHAKIIRKKQQWISMFISAMMLTIFFISYESSNIIQTERYEMIWSEYQYEQTEYYSWEVANELSNEELFTEILDLYEMDEILELLNSSTELLQLLKITNMEG